MACPKHHGTVEQYNACTHPDHHHPRVESGPTVAQIKALEIIRQATADGERYCKEHGFTGGVFESFYVESVAKLLAEVERLEDGLREAETILTKHITALESGGCPNCTNIKQQLAQAEARLKWIGGRVSCHADVSGNAPCTLNEQPDTWCIYHYLKPQEGAR